MAKKPKKVDATGTDGNQTKEQVKVRKYWAQIKKWEVKLERVLSDRQTILDQYIGKYFSWADDDRDRYGNNTSQQSVHYNDKQTIPVNKVFSIIETFVPQFASFNPRFMIKARLARSPFEPMDELATEQEEVAEHFALAYSASVDEEFKRMEYAKTNRMAIRDAFMAFSVLRTGLEPWGRLMELEDAQGVPETALQPYVGRIECRDYVLDPNVRDRKEMLFEGNQYFVNIEYIQGNDKFTQSVAMKMNVTGSATDVGITPGGRGKNKEELVLRTKVIDLWIPDEQRVITIPAEGWGPPEELKSIEHKDPRGPYEIKGFYEVPGFPLPLAQAGIWLDLALLLNTNFRKFAAQAGRQKSFTLVDQKVSDKEKAAYRDAPDGSLLGVENVDRYTQIDQGGVAPDIVNQHAVVNQLLAEIPGNVDVLGGSRTNDPTLGQSELREDKATERVNHMLRVSQEVDSRIGERVADFVWDDEVTERPVTVRFPGGSSENINFIPGFRIGDRKDYVIEAKPYSGKADNPDLRFARKMQVLGQILPALLPFAQAEGKTLDVQKALNLFTEDLDTPELDELIVPIIQPELAGGGQQQGTTINETNNISTGGRGRPSPTGATEGAA